jgi:hypothetical protein
MSAEKNVVFKAIIEEKVSRKEYNGILKELKDKLKRTPTQDDLDNAFISHIKSNFMGYDISVKMIK